MTIKENAKEMIVCRDVQKWFDEFHVLRGINWTRGSRVWPTLRRRWRSASATKTCG